MKWLLVTILQSQFIRSSIANRMSEKRAGAISRACLLLYVNQIDPLECLHQFELDLLLLETVV